MKTDDFVIPQAPGRFRGACNCLGFGAGWGWQALCWILMPNCYVTWFYVDSLVLA